MRKIASLLQLTDTTKPITAESIDHATVPSVPVVDIASVVEPGSDSDSSDPNILSNRTTPRAAQTKLLHLPDDNEALSLVSKKLIIAQLRLVEDVEEGDIHKFKNNAK